MFERWGQPLRTRCNGVRPFCSVVTKGEVTCVGSDPTALSAQKGLTPSLDIVDRKRSWRQFGRQHDSRSWGDRLDTLNLITDVAGVRVGNAEDARVATGVTSIVFDTANVASGVTRGGAPGTRDTTLLDPEMTVPGIDAVLLSGGSLFGLDAAGGAVSFLRAQGRGMRIGAANIPIAAQATTFDLLNGGDKHWGRMPPYWELGWQATAAASSDAFALGTAGGGYGATTATLKGGLGSASATTASGFAVGAIAVVNAVGSAVIGEGPHFWAAPCEVGAEFGGLGQPRPRAAASAETAPQGPPSALHHHCARRHRRRHDQGPGQAARHHGRRWARARHPPRPRADGRRHRICGSHAAEPHARRHL